MAIRINDPLRTKIADYVVAWLSGTGGTSGTSGMLKVYGGTQPTTGGGTAGTQEILVQMDLIGWEAATNGTSAISASVVGTAGTDGDAVWARLSDSSGTAYIIDGGCGTAATCDFVIDEASIAFEAPITLTDATIMQPGS
jgi:hypothetical protein